MNNELWDYIHNPDTGIYVNVSQIIESGIGYYGKPYRNIYYGFHYRSNSGYLLAFDSCNESQYADMLAFAKSVIGV